MSSSDGEEIERGEVENNKEQQNQEESVENEQIEEESQVNVDAAEVEGNNSIDGEIEADEINLQTEVQISENIEEHNSETCGQNIESKGDDHQDDRESEDGLSNHGKLEGEERSLNDQEEEIQEKDEEQRDEGSNSDKIDEQVQEEGLDDEFDKEVDLDSNNDKEEEESHQKRPMRRMIIDSDDEDKEDEQIESEHGQQSEKEEGEDEDRKKEGGDVSELMQNIFGDDMSEDDEEKEKHSGKHDGSDDDDEPKLVRVERSEDEDEDMLGRKWDFDVMLAKKKQERRRRRRRDGSIDLMADADDQIKALVDAMNEAAAEDRNANIDRRPAIKKRKMLPIVKNTLLKADLFEAMLDNGMVSAISEWLAPLPDKSLVALEIRCSLLKILERWPNLEQGILKQSGLGRAVMYLFKHPKETRENKMIAAKLIREWSRPIFQLDSDFRSLSKEERVQRDYSQMPLAKRKRLSVDDDSSIPIFSGANKLQDDDEGKHPGDPGFIPRARVPKPSTKDYVVRPRPEIEGQFRGETKNKQVSRLVRTQRQFQQKNSGGALKRAVGVSISGKNL